MLNELSKSIAIVAAFCLVQSDSRSVAKTASEREHEALTAGTRIRGCVEFLSDLSCLASPDTEFLVWVPRESADIRLEADGVPVDARDEHPRGGTRLSFKLPSSARELAVVTGDGVLLLLLRILRVELDPRLTSADRMRKQRLRSEAEQLIMEARFSGSPWNDAYAEGLLARLSIGTKPSRARFDLERVSKIYRNLDCPSGQLKNLLAATFVSIDLSRNFPLASKYIVETDKVLHPPSELRAQIPYYDACLSLERGDLARALTQIEAAIAESANMSLDDQKLDAEMVEVPMLARLGRPKEAFAVLDRLRKVPDDRPLAPAKLAEIYINLGDYEVIARGAESDWERVENNLNRALELYRELDDQPGQSAALAGLVRAQIERGDPWRAKELFVALDAIPTDPRSEASALRLLLRARLARALGQKQEALELFDALRAQAVWTEDPLNEWRALVGSAETLDALGQKKEAVAVFESADALLDQMFALVPFGNGFDNFIAMHGHAARSHLQTLMSLGMNESALALIRRVRGRQLQRLAASFELADLSAEDRRAWDVVLDEYFRVRQELEDVFVADEYIRAACSRSIRDCKLAKEHSAELEQRRETARMAVRRQLQKMAAFARTQNIHARTPDNKLAEHQLLLAFHPLPDGWGALALKGDQLSAATLSIKQYPSDQEAQALFKPFDALIEDADELLIEAPWNLARLDLRPAQKVQLPIAFVFDLRGQGRVALPPMRRALLVSAREPDSFRDESTFIADVLESRGVRVTHLRGAEVTRRQVLEALTDPSYDAFHFAGHASSSEADGWEAKLLLADGFITSSDVFALRRVPPRIVLSACSSGVPSGGQDAEGLGLAQAFALAGAARIVASTTDVAHSVARTTMEELYECGDPTDPKCVQAATCGEKSIGDCKNPFRLMEAW